MNHNSAPGLDGFSPNFIKYFGIQSNDLMAPFDDFHKGYLPMHKLNFGTIILLPKNTKAKTILQYRLICLANVSFKIFTKVATNRIILVAQNIIQPSQTTFLPGRNIMEGLIILHETIHEMHKKWMVSSLK